MRLSIPNDFVIPSGFETDKFKIRMLKVTDVVKDYDAVMTSLEHLHGVFGENHKWPYPELTFEQDLIDLGWHQKEFQTRSTFAYTVMNQDESICLGCLYIFEPTKKDYDAEVYMWVRTSAFEDGLDPIFEKAVKEWIKSEWPFKKVAYPGREIAWEEWNTLK